ncbi:hypothetical protein [Natronomonas salsuginis]|jgi:hypothetical protein|uniref:DUF8103 domain-containing protein n=1 Tax=Natronomonas salsuginis TaxID=2217661 RepID=A0A4U5JGT9_9EURY|nr:hypothetical protein [Natronomonas salsuginis]TKR28065.1 hypothetical protein DM868_02990 [Natronomonas salsuginis]
MSSEDEDGDEDEIVDWTVLKSIQAANGASMRAMEEYLLVATHPDVVGDSERIRSFLERSIEHHEQVIEQLELAAAEIESNAFVDDR